MTSIWQQHYVLNIYRMYQVESKIQSIKIVKRYTFLIRCKRVEKTTSKWNISELFYVGLICYYYLFIQKEILRQLVTVSALFTLCQNFIFPYVMFIVKKWVGTAALSEKVRKPYFSCFPSPASDAPVTYNLQL